MITLALANRLLDSVLRSGRPVYVSLHTNEPGEDGSSEVFGEGYARQAAAFEEARNRSSMNADGRDFQEMPSVAVSHIGLWDAKDGGVFLWGSDRMDPAVVVAQGGVLRINPGYLAIKLLIR